MYMPHWRTILADRVAMTTTTTTIIMLIIIIKTLGNYTYLQFGLIH